MFTRNTPVLAADGSPSALASSTGLYLTEPTLGTLLLDCDAGYVVTSVDFGFPSVRPSVGDRALQDGTYDTTYLVGARAVSIAITINGRVASPSLLLDRLRAFCHPAYRPYLHFLPTGLPGERRLRLRGQDCPCTIERPLFLEVVGQWVGDQGLVESSEEHTVVVRIGGDTAASGRPYSWTPNRVYPQTGGLVGGVKVVNAGSAAAPWRARIYGGCTNPVLRVNDDEMAFTRNGGLTLAPGESILIDSATRTITADSGESRYDRYDFVTGTWPLLAPGDNYVLFEADAATAESGILFAWRDTWL